MIVKASPHPTSYTRVDDKSPGWLQINQPADLKPVATSSRTDTNTLISDVELAPHNISVTIHRGHPSNSDIFITENKPRSGLNCVDNGDHGSTVATDACVWPISSINIISNSDGDIA